MTPEKRARVAAEAIVAHDSGGGWPTIKIKVVGSDDLCTATRNREYADSEVEAMRAAMTLLITIAIREAEQAAADAEREACARIAERFGSAYVGDYRVEQGPDIAAAIRSRKDGTPS